MAEDRRKNNHGPRRIHFTEEMDNYLRVHYPVGTVLDIAEHFGISPGIVTRRVKELGLVRPEGWRKSLFRGRYVDSYKNPRVTRRLYGKDGFKSYK